MPRQLLGAAVAVALLAALTGGLHLDGLADTGDGLGSRRPAADALAIMRRPDIGPLGVVTLVLVLLIQVTALATVPRGWPAVAALVLAVVTGRVAAVLATGVPAARPGGLRRPGGGPDRAGRAGWRPASSCWPRWCRPGSPSAAWRPCCAGWPRRWPGCWPAACWPGPPGGGWAG